MTLGRPTKFSQKLADEIVTRLEEGESLREICRSDDRMPSRSTINRWQDQDKDFQDRLTQARARGAFDAIDEAREIADLDLKLLSEWDARRYGISGSWSTRATSR